ELLVEDEYSVSANATVYENNEISYEVKILFEYIKGKKFPVQITLPQTDKNGNKTELAVTVDEDMYWHLGVTLDNADATKDDLYIDVYILDCNPAVENGLTTGGKTATGGGLDVFVSVSKYGSKALNENYAPLKVYAPVNEILTVLAAGVALLDLQNIDISGESAALQSVVSQLATLLDNALVKTYLPLTYSQFNSLGASLVPQIIGSDISTLLKDILKTLSSPAQNENNGEKALSSSAPETANPKHYINKVSLGSSGAGDKMLQIVLNSNAIYGGGCENIVFEAYKNYANGAGEEPNSLKSLITGAALKNVYFDGNKKLDLGIDVARSVSKQTAFEGYYDFSGISTLLKAAVNSATHPKANATELDKQIYGENLTDYLLNRYYYLQGKIDLHIPVFNKDYQIGLAAAARIDKDNDVKINLSLDIPAIQEVMQVVTNGNTHTDLTIKNGMVYIKRVQNSYWKKSGLIYSEKKYDTPVTIYRVMPIGEFSANVMDNIVFLMNLGPVVTDNIKDAAPAEPVKDVSDFGAKIGKYLKSFIYTCNSNSANWALTINGGCIDFGTNMIGLNDIVVTLNANSRYDELTNSNLYTLTGLNIKTGLSLANILNITVDGNINYCNPQLVMGKQYKDSTVDLSETWEELLGCDSKTLAVGANGLKEGEEYTPEEIAASELWNRAISSLNGSYAGKNFLEINLSSSTGVNLGEVALNANGNKVGGLTILYGSSGLLSVAPAIPEWEEKTGYTLKVDYVGGIACGANGKLDFSNVTDFASLAVNATYTPNTYKVNVVVDEEKGTVYTVDYVYGTRLPLSQYIGATVKGEDGKVYVLDSFVLNGKKYYGDIEDFNITEETTLIANWTDVTADAEYTVTYVADGKTVATRTVKYGEKISADVVPDFNVTGYDFAGWDFCGVDTCYGNREITAIYTPHVYTVTLDTSAYAGCGKEGQLAEAIAEAGFTDGKLYYAYGDEAIKLTALDNISGYDFVRYYVLNENGEKVDVTSVYMLTEDLTVYAEFNDVRINLNLTSDVAFNYNGQTAVEKGGKFVLNTYMVREESEMLSAENAEGWQFLGWWYAVTDGNGGTAYNSLTDVLSIARPGETVETEIRALWGRANVAGASTKGGSFFKGYDYTMVSTASYEFKGFDGVISQISRTATEYDWYLDNGLTPVMTKEINNVNGNNQLTCTFDKLHIGSTSGIMNNWKVSCRLTFSLPNGTECVLSATSSGKF
ncbi:MAG: InlB B-repeat-containing protein, partial [Clostridia bacterium]|nr:InlB B-repeat-containing protein [Clostridia bacterium]